MRKLKLAVDGLEVETFATDGTGFWKGTVDARAPNTMDECDTQAGDCTLLDPCTADGYATIDPRLCGAGGDYQTVMATTCRITGICCDGPTVNRTMFCCQQTGAC